MYSKETLSNNQKKLYSLYVGYDCSDDHYSFSEELILELSHDELKLIEKINDLLREERPSLTLHTEERK